MHQKSPSPIICKHSPKLSYLLVLLQKLRGEGDFWDTRYIIINYSIICYVVVWFGWIRNWEKSFMKFWDIRVKLQGWKAERYPIPIYVLLLSTTTTSTPKNCLFYLLRKPLYECVKFVEQKIIIVTFFRKKLNSCFGFFSK